LIVQQFPPGVTPYDGVWATWLGGDYDEISYIEQQVLVPSDRPYMSYWHWIASADLCGYDVGGVLVNGAVVEAYWLCQDTNTGGWVQRVIDLRGYAGSTVSIQIKSVTDGSLNSNLFIDHVDFQPGQAGTNPPPEDITDIDATILKQDVIGK
jgi:hypothetical protein